MQWLKSRRLHFLLGGVVLLFLLFALLRAVFILGFSAIDALSYTPRDTFWKTLLIGLRFDLRLAIIAMLPLALLCFLPRFNVLRSRPMSHLAHLYIAVGLLLVILIYILDMGHYQYLGVRLNSTAWRYVADAGISSTMLWQSYPVVWILLGWLSTAALWFAAFILLERYTLQRAPRPISRRAAALGWSVMVVLTFLGLLGRVTDINPENPVPLRWSDAFFSGDLDLAAIGLNPVIFFLYDTAWMKDEPYDRELVTQYYPLMADYLGVGNPNRETLDFNRHVGPQPHRLALTNPPNVIFVMLESLNASRLGIHGNPLAPTPNLDRIAREGWFFERFFVPVTGTAKTVWASITGTPDVTQQETATRNPLITRQHTLINAFRGYDKLYMIGGSAGWANMNALVRQSIDDVKLYEEGYWKGANVDVWGVSDLQLFREADEILRNRPTDRPFFAYIQTAGNHRPYTIPSDRESFEVLNLPEGEVQKWSFTGNDQFNAVRFLDYSIGRFLEMAQAGGYLDNSIFVFFGDHGTTITTQPHMPPLYEQMWLESNHVPHIIYAPGLLQPRIIEDAVSLVDMLPTVAGLVGLPYDNRTQGRDYQASAGRDRAVPVVLVEGAFPIIGLVTRDFMVKMNYDGSDASLHAMDSATPRDDISAQHPEVFERLRQLTRGAYESARYMLYDNVRKSGVTE
ncbi:MAG: sulfatase-like hydrolase/transferase [Porticoccaceae bacterium]